MTPRLQKTFAWVGYPLFYFACLVIFCYVCLPWDRVKTAIVSSFNGSSATRLQIDKLTWSFRFPGVVAKGVRFIGATPPTEGGAKPKAPPEYDMDEMYARVSVLPLLWGTTKLAFSLDGFGGNVDGEVKSAPDSRDVTLELDGVDAAKTPYLSDMLGVPVGGTVTGKIDLKLPQGKLSLADGTVDLEISDFEIGDGKTKIREMIALPKVKAGTFHFKADVTEGTVKLTELSTKGPDLDLVSDGRIRLTDIPQTSLVELNLRFRFSDAYKNKDDMTRSIFGAPGSTVPGIFDLDPKMKRAKREDGFYVWRISGPLERPSVQPAASPLSERGRGRRSQLRGFAPRGLRSAPAETEPPEAPMP